MGLVPEFIKDLLGVMDDVEDFTDRSVKVRTRLDRTLALVEDGSEWLKDRLRAENIRTPSDLKFLVAYMRGITGKKGEILKMLTADADKIDELLQKAEKAKSRGKIEGISRVVQTLKKLKQDITRTTTQHRAVFREADNIIRAHARMKRSDRFTAVLRLIVGAALSFATATVVLRGMNQKSLAGIGILKTAAGAVKSGAGN